MVAETYALIKKFDAIFILKHTLERIYRQIISISMLTDSKKSFDVITKATHSAVKILMLQIAVTREAYNKKEISIIGSVLFAHNIAAGLAKIFSSAALLRVMATGLDEHPVQHWLSDAKNNLYFLCLLVNRESVKSASSAQWCNKFS